MLEDVQYAGRTRTVDLPYSGGTWTLLTRPTPWDAMQLSGFMDSLTETAKEYSDKYNFDVNEVYAALGAMTVSWSFDDAVSIQSIMSRDMEDLKTIMEVFVEESVPFFERVATEEQLKAFSSASESNRASRRNGQKRTSSSKQAGRGKSTSTPRKTSPNGS